MDALLFIYYMLIILSFFCAAGAIAWLLEKVVVVIDLDKENTQ